MLRELLPKLLACSADSSAVAICRLVETRGSTPQKAGAAMLVFADGSQAGTLGGGCVEAEVKRKALAALASRQVTLEKFQLDDDYGWDDGLICGGRMLVHIHPIANADARHYYQQLEQQTGAGEGVTEAIVFDDQQSGLPYAGCFLFDSKGQLLTATGADSNPAETAKKLAAMLPDLSTRPGPGVASGVALLPTLPRCRLIIVGGGHVGQAVARLASDLDFIVWVIDDRQEYVSAERFPTAERRLSGTIGEVLPGLEITSSTYCLIVTRGHNHDEEALYHLANRGARYVGMIGSKRKIRLIFDDLQAEGVPPEVLEKVHAPVGLDIGSQTVPEIAVSIAAELIADRNRGAVGTRGRGSN